MSPDEINREHGKPVWRCFGCKTDAGLHWWNSLSVAVCDESACSAAYRDALSKSVREQEDFEAYVRENAPY